MSKTELYTVGNLSKVPNRYVVDKYDHILLLPTGHYNLSRIDGRFECDCPAQNRPTCRHKELVEIFIDTSSLNSGSLYNYDKKRWDGRKAPMISNNEENDETV